MSNNNYGLQFFLLKNWIERAIFSKYYFRKNTLERQKIVEEEKKFILKFLRQHTIESALLATEAASAAFGSPVQSWTFGHYDSL